jgi:hypothetical protein
MEKTMRRILSWICDEEKRIEKGTFGWMKID